MFIEEWQRRDIRFYPSALESIDGKTARVYKSNGYRCGITDIEYIHGCPVDFYTVECPDGTIMRHIIGGEVEHIIGLRK